MGPTTWDMLVLLQGYFEWGNGYIQGHNGQKKVILISYEATVALVIVVKFINNLNCS